MVNIIFFLVIFWKSWLIDFSESCNTLVYPTVTWQRLIRIIIFSEGVKWTAPYKTAIRLGFVTIAIAKKEILIIMTKVIKAFSKKFIIPYILKKKSNKTD